MLYPGQRVQIDVKVVPKSCIVPNVDGLQERFNIRLLTNTPDFGSLWLLRNNLLIFQNRMRSNGQQLGIY